MQRAAGWPVRKAHWRKHSTAMVSRCNAADRPPGGSPAGGPAQRFAALGKGTTIPCAPCLDPNHLWDSACGFIYVVVSILHENSILPTAFCIGSMGHAVTTDHGR